MRTHYYTDERNVQIVIALLKACGVCRVGWGLIAGVRWVI